MDLLLLLSCCLYVLVTRFTPLISNGKWRFTQKGELAVQKQITITPLHLKCQVLMAAAA
jgi:hypothetical protein